MIKHSRRLLPFFLLSLAFATFTLATAVRAHEHDGDISEEEANAPVDSILWLHILLQAVVWGILFPIGMVFGLSRSRWHVPLQIAGIVLTLGGYVLGHAHGGRLFLPSAHGMFANILLVPLATQLALGVYLKLHIHERTLRPWAVRAHGIVGKSYPILGWTQILFGVITFRGYCRNGALPQCLAHYIMGSGFIAYGVILAILLLVGEAWVRRSGRSPDWWDSWVILLWVLNTFTEHRGSVWSVKDMQHTILGILWWCGGLLGVYLSRNTQRTVIPSVIIILTGYAMSDHAQALMLSTKVHAVFGYTLMLAGLTRLIEVCFVAPSYTSADGVDDDRSDHTLADGAGVGAESSTTAFRGRAFRHLPPILLVGAGLLFMSATDEELQYVHEGGMDHVTYILILFSITFLLYNHIVLLITLYATSGRNASDAASMKDASGSIELTATPTASRGAWYSRVRSEESPAHVIGNDDEDEED
ncbi:hypothetical protein B0F90DRAFT_1634350 [Multifurca ochricompacta]|uniref:Uncharacterized protein n=1 Tax=Multifurca ochricompacta TaxID=376703 RepID=A0AAD4M0X6_9AGAM|nr:hypothetical protein B0F90DRAFT_1634350 [Multifurca ochricompacta]